ncbi:MAG: hypothetical protein GEU90_10970 [Gemmatimonas sp.]|nr:hypothetical protein [Gemmatimonas sp.]
MNQASSSIWIAPPVLAAIALLAFPRPAFGVQSYAAATAPAEKVTFASDIAPLLQQKCQACHQPGGIAPMSLQTYQEVRPWAQVIKEKVTTRIMPPWHIDRSVGIQEFKNDISLSDEQIAMISRWVDSGAPEGDPAELPPPVEWPDGSEWILEEEFGRPPDYVIKTSPFSVPASGNDQWWMPQEVVDGLDGPRYVMANETRPTIESRPVTHHANSDVSNFGVGKPFDIYPTDTGLLLSPGDTVGFNIHYFPVGEAVEEASIEVGLWFYPRGEEPRLKTDGDKNFSSYRRTEGRQAQEMVIPPNGTITTQGIHVLQTPARIHSVRGHMHLLGTAQSLEAIYPDGRVEILSRLFWKHNWHITYLYEDHAQPLLPKGTVLIVTAWYDNTANNPANPDPDTWVVHGRRTVDEMSHMWIGFTALDDEQFTVLVEEREQLLQERRLAQQRE